jgi:xanthine dehydrogenase large subunit
LGFGELAKKAHEARIHLSSTGFYATPKLDWNRDAASGRPFLYFAYGAACSEVTVDTMTGEMRVDRVDILHDVGRSLNPAIDIGQIEGGFVQGAGWLTLEDLRWDEGDGPTRGRLATQSASTYKLPSLSEMPEVFNVSLLEHAHEDGVVYGSKAVGEPPLMLAFSVREALRQAAAAFGPAGPAGAAGPGGAAVHLATPATPEAVWWAIESARSQRAEDSEDRRAERACVTIAHGQPRRVEVHEPDQPPADAPPLAPESEQLADSGTAR